MDLLSPGTKAKEILFPNCRIVEDNITRNLAIVEDNGVFYLTSTTNEIKSGTKVIIGFTISESMLKDKLPFLKSQLQSAKKNKNILWGVIGVLFLFVFGVICLTVWGGLVAAAAGAFAISQGRGFPIGKQKVISLFTMALTGTDINIKSM